MKTWFQNRRAKWRRLKQDSQDGEGESQETKNGERKKMASEDENSSADDESSPLNKEKDSGEEKEEDVDVGADVEVDACEAKTANNFTLPKPNGSNSAFTSNHLGESPVSGIEVGKEQVNNVEFLQFQPQGYTSTNTNPCHRLSSLNPLGQPYYPNQVLHHPQPYNPASYYPNHDYQTQLISPPLQPTFTSINNVSPYEPYSSSYSLSHSLSCVSSSALTIDPSPE